MGKKIQRQGKCIFCGGKGLTKQHVLPDWLREYFPRTANDTKTQNLMYFKRNENSMLTTPNIQKTQGHLGNVRIRNVCEKCNSGWISGIKNATKPIVEELLQGHIVKIDKEMQHLLSQWLMVVNIMIEYTDSKTITITEGDRKMVMNGIIPDGWKIWIGYCENKNWEFRYRHNAVAVMKKSDYQRGCDVPEKCNIQYTTVGIGRLYIHMTKNYSECIIPTIRDYESLGLIQICPFTKEIPVTIVPKYINNMDAEIIPDLIYNEIVRSGGRDIDTVFVNTSNLLK